MSREHMPLFGEVPDVVVPGALEKEHPLLGMGSERREQIETGD